MNRIKLVTFLTFVQFLSVCTSSQPDRTVSCILSNDDSTCEISGLNLTKMDHQFVPNSPNPELITSFYFTSSVVPVLTKSICEQFPNIQKFDVQLSSIDVIEEDTFQKCSHVTVIDLDNNPISMLQKNTFANLEHLRILYMTGISTIDEDLFADLTQLTTLWIRYGTLTEIPSRALRNLKNLYSLYLTNNKLFDLDVENILKYRPNLQSINLSGNSFKCSRVQEILLVLGNRTTLQKSDCLDDDDWIMEHSKILQSHQSDDRSFYERTTEIAEVKYTTTGSQARELVIGKDTFEETTVMTTALQNNMNEYVNNEMTTTKTELFSKPVERHDINDFHQLLNEIKTESDGSIKLHLFGLWIVSGLCLMSVFIIIIVYVTKSYRRSGVYDAFAVRYNNGLVTSDDNEK